jgi:hypothetical protein
MIARVSQLHKTEQEWLKVADWIPAAGELIVYDSDDKYNYARIKIGDGQKALKDLPFLIDEAVAAFVDKALQRDEYIDGGRIK